MTRRVWLIKSEPNKYSIDDLKRDQVTQWDGVRNYQARNYLREMEPGDLLLYYHSVVEPLGIAGLARVRKKAYPDSTQFDPKSEYFDPKATKKNPRWFAPDVEFVQKFATEIPLKKLRSLSSLKKMVLLQRLSRLSVQPVRDDEYKVIVELSRR